MFMVFGLLIENLMTMWKYADRKNEIIDTITPVIGNKHEILMKLFRAERNAYLTFIVNFNWMVLYGIHHFIITICHLESNKIMNDVIVEALHDT